MGGPRLKVYGHLALFYMAYDWQVPTCAFLGWTDAGPNVRHQDYACWFVEFDVRPVPDQRADDEECGR